MACVPGGQLLHEKGNSIGLGDDLLHHLRRQLLAAGHLLDNSLDLLPIEPPERQGSDIGQTGPGGLKARSEGNDRRDRQMAESIRHEVKQFNRGRVCPMGVRTG
jgi:hypothetical protein